MKNIYRWITVFLLLFVALPLFLAYIYYAYFNFLPEVLVPNVTGIALEEAKEKLEEMGLQARMAGSVYEMKYPEGHVASQRPEPGRKVKAGRAINLMLSSGKKKIKVPNLLGRPASQVDTVLSAVELKMGEVRYETNLNAPDGTILAQEPLPEEEAEMGQGIDLLVSTTQELPAVVEATEEAEPEENEGGFKLW